MAVGPDDLMTDAEYVAEGGAWCPWCRSGNLEARTPDFDGTVCLVVVDCADCGETWTDRYDLVGYLVPDWD